MKELQLDTSVFPRQTNGVIKSFWTKTVLNILIHNGRTLDWHLQFDPTKFHIDDVRAQRPSRVSDWLYFGAKKFQYNQQAIMGRDTTRSSVQLTSSLWIFSGPVLEHGRNEMSKKRHLFTSA